MIITEIVISDKLEEEFEKVITHPKNRRYFSIEIAMEYFRLIKQRSRYLIPVSPVSICRDPKDNHILSLAKDAGADYIITGDKDLLVLEKFEETIICTLNDFTGKYLSK
jgi:uncharacterized protein